MNLDFPEKLILPQRTIFKKGACLGLSRECLVFGSRGIIVHGRSLADSGKLKEIAEFFPDKSVETFCRASAQEPDLEEISELIVKARAARCEWIAGVGGGSVIDLAKAAAGLFNCVNMPVYYQEGGVPERLGIPFIAVPTTAGTGAEASPNSVITNKEKKSKLSIRHENFLARTVILDVELLKTLPKENLVYSSMDAFVQAYESYTSRNCTWLSETLALKALRLINDNIIPAVESYNEGNLESLLLGSYLGGVAFSSSRLGVIHGIAHPLGALYGFPHGLICSVCFIPSIKLNKEYVGNKYSIISDAFGEDFIKRVNDIIFRFKIRSPFKGSELTEKERIIKDTLASGSTAANSRKITAEDVETILKELF